MKVFKRILAGAVSAAVIVSALAVPTAALSSTMTHNKKAVKFIFPTVSFMQAILPILQLPHQKQVQLFPAVKT